MASTVVGAMAATMPDCSTTGCDSLCSCVEKQCGNLYAGCAADSQCNGIMTCLLDCSCGDALCALGCAASAGSLDSTSSKVKSCATACATTDPEWEEYKKAYRKHYIDDADEHERYQLFLESKERVASLNKLNEAAGNAFGLNWMSDRKPEEKFKKGLAKRKADFKPTAPVREWTDVRSPSSINWRDTEAVTAIKNQGQCGSCWAFSATEAIESQLVLTTGGKLAIDLSPQHIASCTTTCYGCNGGFTEDAYDYVKSVAGLANSFYIPYNQSLTEVTDTMACPADKVAQIDGEYQTLQGGFAAVSGYHYAVPACTSGACDKQDLKGFAAALETTPVSVCVNAGAWNDYTGGVMTAKACGSSAADEQDHCVMATGFNTTAPTPYWIVRNSWSSTWGEEGYIYLEMAENTCGVADDATIPDVKLDLSADERSSAVLGRERMFRKATLGATFPTVVL